VKPLARPVVAACRVVIVTLTMLAASSLSAHGQDAVSFLGGVVKHVTLDPTTYAPAVAGWTSTRLDWRSSQAFFEHGWVEGNSRFTVSGRGNDIAIGYAAGNRQILVDALGILQLSAVNNVSERVLERWLMPRFPNHRKLLAAIGWIERSALASYWSYRLSAGHLRQWRRNERLARQLGYK
jgi:hypothetical protein